MLSEQTKRVAEAIMIARYGSCKVRDWDVEAIDNPSVGEVVSMAHAAAEESDKANRKLLRLFRDFYIFYVTQQKIGAGHHHPIWQDIANALGDDNLTPLSEEEWRYITGPFYEFEREISRVTE